MAAYQTKISELTFLKWLPIYETTQPYELIGFPDVSEAERSNCVFETLRDIRIHDARGAEDSFRLSDQGFCFLKHVSKCLPTISAGGLDMLGDTPPIAYIEETANVVKEMLNAEHVICFDWRLRRNEQGTTHGDRMMAMQEESRNSFVPVARILHCDHSSKGGEARLDAHLNHNELEAVRRGEFTAIIVNFWRPLRTVYNAPLVLCDKRTVRKSDLVEVDKVQPNTVTQDLYIRFSETQRWYYLSQQTTDEVTMFVGWQPEIKSDEMAEYPPHGSTNDPAESEVTARQSIEVRMIVLFPKS